MKLMVARGTEVIAQRELGPVERRANLGADPRNEVVLENDPDVSARHAELERRGGVWRLRDLRSAKGTLVNDHRIKSAALRDGDVITLGSHHLKVMLDAAEQASAAADAGGGDPALSPDNLGHVVIETGGKQAVALLDRDSFLIGKDDGCDLRLTGWGAPGQLAVIVRGQAGTYSLINLAGSGVFHNAKDVELRVALKDGDRMELRDFYLTFHKGLPKAGKP